MPNALLLGTVPELLEQRRQAFEAAGYDVRIAHDLKSALRIVGAAPCDVIVIGHAVGERARTSLARTLKAKPRPPKIICLYLAAIRNAEEADAVLQVTSGVQGLVRTADLLIDAAADGH